MLRHLRFDRPTVRKPLGRRLSLQRLEERLTLSTVSPVTTTTLSGDFSANSLDGGFVYLDTQSAADSVVAYEFSVPTVAIVDGLQDADKDFHWVRAGAALTSVDLTGDWNSFESDVANVIGLGIQSIPPVDPFPTDPDGGLVGTEGSRIPYGPRPPAESLPSGTQVSSEISTETSSSLAAESQMADESSQTRTSTLVLSRGRDVSFRVATLAPPRTIVRAERVAFGTKAAHRTPVRSEVASPAPVARGEQAEAPVANDRVTEAAFALPPAGENAASVSRQQGVTRAAGAISIHDSLGVNQVSLAGKAEAAGLISARLVAVAESETEAHDQVFSDWRNRDLIAVPLLVALAAGPYLARHRRSTATDAQQLPPKKNRQTVTL